MTALKHIQNSERERRPRRPNLNRAARAGGVDRGPVSTSGFLSEEIIPSESGTEREALRRKKVWFQYVKWGPPRGKL